MCKVKYNQANNKNIWYNILGDRMFLSFVDYSKNKDLKTLKILIYQNIEYFYNNNEGCMLILTNCKVQYKYSAIHFLNYLYKLGLSSYKSYSKAINDIFSYKYNIPFIIDNVSLILSGNINSFETIYFNMKNVLRIKELGNNNINIIFKSGKSIEIKKSSNYINNQIIKIEKIKRYLKWNYKYK